MEAILLIGISGSGKTTFYRRRFFSTHVRISLDLVRTRRRERLLVEACLAGGQWFVIDNTNVRFVERAAFLAVCRPARFRVIGYEFEPDLAGAIARNRLRAGRARVPDKAVRAMYRRLEPPMRSEGFDALYHVRLLGPEQYEVVEWDGLGQALLAPG